MSKLLHEHILTFEDMGQLLVALIDAEKVLENNDNYFLESEITMNKTNYTLYIKIFNT